MIRWSIANLRELSRAVGCRTAPVLCISFATLACGGHGSQEPLTLLASFPDDAVAVCFVREDTGTELGCTTQALRAGPDGTVSYQGATLELRNESPTGLVAIVGGIQAPEISGDKPLKVRAVAYNEAGASDPSAQFFALEHRSRGFLQSQEDGVGLASRKAEPARPEPPGAQTP